MNLKITLDQMKDLSIDEIIRLYQMGHRLDHILPENKLSNSDQIVDPFNLRELENKLSNSDQIVDPYVNFGKVAVYIGYDDSATSITLNAGNGSIFPDPSAKTIVKRLWNIKGLVYNIIHNKMQKEEMNSINMN